MATVKETPKEFSHKLPAYLKKVIVSDPKLSEKWDKLTPLARNEWICWVTIVKKVETREEHIVRMQEEILAGKKRPCCWPGCPHRRLTAAKWFKSVKIDK